MNSPTSFCIRDTKSPECIFDKVCAFKPNTLSNTAFLMSNKNFVIKLAQEIFKVKCSNWLTKKMPQYKSTHPVNLLMSWAVNTSSISFPKIYLNVDPMNMVTTTQVNSKTNFTQCGLENCKIYSNRFFKSTPPTPLFK